MNAIIDRILTKVGEPELIAKLSALSGSDFSSFLLSLFQERAHNVMPVDLVKAFKANRFTAPGEADPSTYHLLEADLLALAKEMDIQPVLLSPAAPFASCSAFGCVDQNNVVGAARGTEMLSDPTNMLAIIIAAQRGNKKTDGMRIVHRCSTARVLRAQMFPSARAFHSHFGLLCIVSAGMDTGSYRCEKSMLLHHMRYYNKLIMNKSGAQLSIVLQKRRGYTDNAGFFGSMTELIHAEFPDVAVSLDLDHDDNNYYKGINIKFYIVKGNDSVEVGDGGFVDWMQRLTGNKKERCFISGIGLDRFLSIASQRIME